MKVGNKDFWEDESVIGTQDRTVAGSADYEIYLYEKVAKKFEGTAKKLKAKIFGCGTGREIPEVLEHANFDTAVASDIAENMIKKCDENLRAWGISDKVETLVADAALYKGAPGSFQLVTIMNSMLTYVVDKKQRDKIFQNSYNLLEDGGCIIGVVHHQKGAPAKTLYFLMRRIFGFLLTRPAGFRHTGFKGFRVEGYYFTKKDIYNHLHDHQFQDIEILSLWEYYERKNFKYDKRKGYNNLIFFATKP